VNVLIVGTGAREHALTWKVLQSPLSRAVFCAPGNAATGAIAVNVPVPTTDVDGIARLAHEREIDLTIVGPEGAVAAGVVDRLTSVGRLALGPTAAAGRIESSKVFAKTLMQKVGVPTPAFAVFTEASAAKAYVQKQGRPFVVKADGLAKGKGSIVPDDIPETLEAIDTFMLSRAVGAAADQVLLEERVEGKEVSLLALVDGERVIPMVPACDYKRALDDDRGPNTGGMGGYSPPGFFTDDDVRAAVATVFQPVVDELRARGTPYRGCLYAGLIQRPTGVEVLEFNARFGDPETQVILPRLSGDVLPAFQAAAAGNLSPESLSWSDRVSVGVVLASRGYPGHYQTGHPVEGLSRLEPDVFAFHGGTVAAPDGYRTAGGRVLTLVALGDTLADARDRVYRSAQRVSFEGMSYRRDIAQREITASVAS